MERVSFPSKIIQIDASSLQTVINYLLCDLREVQNADENQVKILDIPKWLQERNVQNLEDISVSLWTMYIELRPNEALKFFKKAFKGHIAYDILSLAIKIEKKTSPIQGLQCVDIKVTDPRTGSFQWLQNLHIWGRQSRSHVINCIRFSKYRDKYTYDYLSKADYEVRLRLTEEDAE